MRTTALFLVALFLAVACSHTPPKGELESKIQPHQLLIQACLPGQGLKEVKGTAWMRAKSPDASGQFPASIDAVAPSDLKLEVEKPLGGTAANLTISGSVYRVEVPGKPDQGREGRDHWGGIPLKWATDLFLGKIPCPAGTVRDRAALSISPQNELIVVIPASASVRAEKYIYRFDEKQGRYWPTALHWETIGAAVDFAFSDPDIRTLSPMKWEAHSKNGEVKIHWRDREVVR